MKQVYRARDSVEAHFIRAQLEARGIAAIVQGESLQTVTGDIPFFHTGPTVHTRDEDAEDALAAIAELATPAAATPGERWTCPTCGEAIEPQFTECWRCATDEGVAPAGTLGVLCARCGYPLRGLPEAGECPECGWPYERRLHHDEG